MWRPDFNFTPNESGFHRWPFTSHGCGLQRFHNSCTYHIVMKGQVDRKYLVFFSFRVLTRVKRVNTAAMTMRRWVSGCGVCADMHSAAIMVFHQSKRSAAYCLSVICYQHLHICKNHSERDAYPRARNDFMKNRREYNIYCICSVRNIKITRDFTICGDDVAPFISIISAEEFAGVRVYNIIRIHYIYII